MNNKIFLFLLFYILSSFSVFSQDNHKKNFPKQEIKVDKLPEKSNLWIFILTGQSNMAGRGFVEPSDTVPNERILTINKNNEWILAKEPLHFYYPRLAGLDCGMSFSRKLIKKLPDSVSVAILPCAVGGSAIQQWIGDSLHRNVQLLTNFKEKVDLAKEYGTLQAVLWHQGESDSHSDRRKRYDDRLDTLFTIFRSFAKNSSLPIFMGELGVSKVPEVKRLGREIINDKINDYAANHNNTFVIKTKNLPLKKDNVHFKGKSLRMMGKRFAKKFLQVSTAL